MDNVERAWEARCRRAATRQGLLLRRSRVRDQRGQDYGTYGLINKDTGVVEHGSPSTGCGLELEDIERILGSQDVWERRATIVQFTTHAPVIQAAFDNFCEVAGENLDGEMGDWTDWMACDGLDAHTGAGADGEDATRMFMDTLNELFEALSRASTG